MLIFGLTAAQDLSLLLSAVFLSYWVFILRSYLRRKPTQPGDGKQFQWHLFVPCRDEAAVIADTLSYLRATFPAVTVWVIDDDSRDDTAAIVAKIARRDRQVHLVRRRQPDARIGKGEALNAAYRALRKRLGPDADLGSVIVGVVDADGRPSAGCLDACAGPDYFGNPAVGGIQVEVRIINRNDQRPLAGRGRLVNFLGRTLVRMQDIEFRAVIGGLETSRSRTRSVAMGGNGQFTRLSAIASLDDGDGRAWRGSLLEDYELGVHLMLAGWRTEFCYDAWVDQEGLPSLRRYLAQRTRWSQGVMQCRVYLPKVWSSPNLSHGSALEISYFLAQAWLTLLGSIVFPIPFIALTVTELRSGATFWQFMNNGGWLMAAMYLALGTTPFWAWGPVYRRNCEPDSDEFAALGWGVAYLVYMYSFYLTAWRAFGRILRGQHGWVKTRRNAEFDPALAPSAARCTPSRRPVRHAPRRRRLPRLRRATGYRPPPRACRPPQTVRPTPAHRPPLVRPARRPGGSRRPRAPPTHQLVVGHRHRAESRWQRPGAGTTCQLCRPRAKIPSHLREGQPV